MNFIHRFFPIHRFKYSNKAIKILIVSDTIFFSGMALVDAIFSVFIVSQIKGAGVIDIGVGNAIFMLGVLVAEPLFSKFFDAAKNPATSFYGFLIGNLLKSVFRILFIFISSVNMFYAVYFLLGIVHAVEYPAFTKVFSKHIDQGYESSEWGFKDIFISLGKVITLFASGYIAVEFGYNVLFISSAIIMVLSGVIYPYLYRKEFVVE